jgi:hypothetical protein
MDVRFRLRVLVILCLLAIAAVTGRVETTQFTPPNILQASQKQFGVAEGKQSRLRHSCVVAKLPSATLRIFLHIATKRLSHAYHTRFPIAHFKLRLLSHGPRANLFDENSA